MSLGKTGISYLDYGWNPGGMGCSHGCPGCWARAMAARFAACPKCQRFEVHQHPERFAALASHKKPGVVGVNFTCDAFDPLRTGEDVSLMLFATSARVQRVDGLQFLYLTKRYGRIQRFAQPLAGHFYGVTIRDACDWDQAKESLRYTLGRRWISAEPLCGKWKLDFKGGAGETEGIVIGCDNRASVPCDLAWVRSLVGDARELGISIFVKQLRIEGALVDNPAFFPADLRIRELPWNLRTK